MKISGSDQCPCGSQQSYADCCRPLLAGQAVASSATQLMRSRYTANVLGDLTYLRATWWPAHCPPLSQDSQIHWCALQITQSGNVAGNVDPLAYHELTAQQRQVLTLAQSSDQPPDQPASSEPVRSAKYCFDQVSFIATYQDVDSKTFGQLSETSQFVYITSASQAATDEFSQRWLYLDGEADWRTIELGRNDICLCGSGKKYKRCCG